LFIPPGKSEPARLQGAFIASEDTERLMSWYEAKRDARRAALAAQGLVVEEPVSTEPDIIETIRAREAMPGASDRERELRVVFGLGASFGGGTPAYADRFRLRPPPDAFAP
jgi:hypothetical protein